MRILELVLLSVGLLWAGQGLGSVGGSFMTGQREWLVIGVATAAVGVALLAFGARRA